MISFSGRPFERAIILQAVRWYLAYALSYRDVGELMLERGVEVSHSTVNRWVRCYAAQLSDAFEARKRPVGLRWRMDETYVKVRGQWKYLYRAVDQGQRTFRFRPLSVAPITVRDLQLRAWCPYALIVGPQGALAESRLSQR